METFHPTPQIRKAAQERTTDGKAEAWNEHARREWRECRHQWTGSSPWQRCAHFAFFPPRFRRLLVEQASKNSALPRSRSTGHPPSGCAIMLDLH